MRIEVTEKLWLYAREPEGDHLKELERIVKEYEPDVIAVEMDKRRYEPIYKQEEWENQRLSSMLKKDGKFFTLMAQLFYLSVEQRILTEEERWDTEYSRAIELARERGKDLVFVDRKVDESLKRAWSCMTNKEKMRLSWRVRKELLAVRKEEPVQNGGNGKDAMEVMIGELASISPKTTRVLVDEREDYMAERISSLEGKGKVLVVLSPLHIEGVLKRLKEKKRKDLRELEEIPPTVKLKRFYWILPICFLTFLFYSLYDESDTEIIGVLYWWIVTTSALSTAGAVLARAHWKTIISVMFLAPIFSFVLIGSGWIAGIIELAVNKPMVKDIQDLGQMRGWGELLRNRAIKPLVVGLSVNGCNILAIIFVLPYIIQFGMS